MLQRLPNRVNYTCFDFEPQKPDPAVRADSDALGPAGVEHRKEEANLNQQRKLLVVMLDAVYVDTVEEKAVMAMRTKPGFPASLRDRDDPRR